MASIPGGDGSEVNVRDPQRSRRLILDAAERLFAERGFDGVGVREIAATAGLSRQMPSYLFGSKEKLYRAVLERVSADRQSAVSDAMGPVLAWCREGRGRRGLRRALTQAMDSYMEFFLARPSFASLISWEERAGVGRLGAAQRDSTALTDTFRALSRTTRSRGLRSFAVDDAVLLWVALAYAPLANRSTVQLALGRDLRDPKVRRKHIAFAVEQLLMLIGGAAETM